MSHKFGEATSIGDVLQKVAFDLFQCPVDEVGEQLDALGGDGRPTDVEMLQRQIRIDQSANRVVADVAASFELQTPKSPAMRCCNRNARRL